MTITKRRKDNFRIKVPGRVFPKMERFRLRRARVKYAELLDNSRPLEELGSTTNHEPPDFSISPAKTCTAEMDRCSEYEDQLSKLVEGLAPQVMNPKSAYIMS